jgi:D-alanyl-D-alanine dipeptidase
MRNFLFLGVGLLFVMIASGRAESAEVQKRPADFVDVHTVDPSIVVEMRYFGDHNFVGRRIPGYEANRCLLTRPAAAALGRIQHQLRAFGLSLKLYDCYRPQRAVDYFVKWAEDPADAAMKQEFYPEVPKDALIPRGYIASPSSHSRGSTVDVTIVSALPADKANRKPPSCGSRDTSGVLDMGAGFDCFDESAHIHAGGLSASERAHRMLLQDLFVQAGFAPYPDEWWHFTLKDEPYPRTYFNFPVR